MRLSPTHTTSPVKKIFLLPLKTLTAALFPSQCAFCPAWLTGRDYQRICLSCVNQLQGTHLLAEDWRCSKCDDRLVLKAEAGGATNKRYCPSCRLAGLLAERNVSVFFNEGRAKELLHEYKFNKRPSYAEVLCAAALQHQRTYLEQYEFFVPLALGRKGKFERDFCPVTLPVRRLARRLGKKLVFCLKRNEKNYYQQKSQSQKSAKQRAEEIAGKYFYVPRRRGLLRGKRVLLFDDVLTTGSTVNYATQLLLENNPGVEVGVFTFFRTAFKAGAS